MRALLLLLFVLGLVWLWRSRPGAKDQEPPRSPAPPAAEPQEMVRCRQCGVHLPAAEALQGKQGCYCCLEHLHQSEP